MIILKKKNYTVFVDKEEVTVLNAGVASTYPIWAFKNRTKFNDFTKDIVHNNGYKDIGEFIGTALSKFNQISIRGFVPSEEKQKEARRIKIDE